MSFWLHQYSATRCLSSIAPRYCYGAALLMSLIGVSILSFYTVLPIQRQVHSIERQLAALEIQVAAFEQIVDQKKKLTEDHARLVSQKQAFTSDIATLQDTLNDLLLVMRDHKVSCRGIVPLAGKQEGLHEKHIVAVKAKGSFFKILSLLQAFEQPHYPITMRAVRIVKARGSLVALDATVQIVSVKEA